MRKTFASLSTSKGRKETGLFMAQGTKCVLDTIDYFELECLLATSEWAEKHKNYNPLIVKNSDLQKISTLTTAPQVIAIYKIPEQSPSLPSAEELSLALDCIQDPGNLGTIIRIADWMGVKHIYASADTADVWNPKVIQATMGAISRVKIHYCDLCDTIAKAKCGNVYGTFLEGTNIYKTELKNSGIVVMGNEGNGISDGIARLVTDKLFIPPYPLGSDTSESLNVAVATAITLSEFRRNG